MTKLIKRSAWSLPALALLLGVAPVFAEGGLPSSGDSRGGETAQVRTASETDGSSSTVPETTKARLEAAHEKACGVKKDAVSKAEGRVGKRAQGRLDAITKIADKVENYIKTNNLTVTNYDSLVSTIDAKKAAAQAAVNTVNAEVGSVGSVTCQGGDGKAQVETFKKDMRTQQDALKAYRQAVKALVAAAKVAKTSTGGTQQ